MYNDSHFVFFAFLNGKTLQQILADRKVKLSVPKLVENICLPYSSKNALCC